MKNRFLDTTLDFIEVSDEPRAAAARPKPGPVHEAADSFVKKFENTVRYAFAKGRTAIDREALQKAETQGGALEATAPATFAVERALDDLMFDLMLDCMEAGGVAALEQFRVSEFRAAKEVGNKRFGPLRMRFDVKNERAIAWAKKHAAEMVKDVTKTTREDIKDAIVNAFQKGTLRSAYEDILEAVGDKARANLIARTESMRAANGGQREAWQQAQDEGLLPKRARKVWIYTDDGSVCDECTELDGKRAPLDGEYPDDGGEGPPLHPNCRCTEGIIGG